MAPIESPAITPPKKRPSPSPEASSKLEPPAKRLKRPYHHHHGLRSPVEPGLLEPAITDDGSVDSLLNLSIGRALSEAGFTHADPVALDSLRDGVEEYMVHFLAYIRESMASCRRTAPIPNDFEHALRHHNLRVDSLRPHLNSSPPAASTSKSTSPTPLLPTPPPEEPESRTDLPFLGPELNGSATSYIPKHFPQFPSRHTYQQTPVYTKRETDPRRVRQKATEEGRLGEEALRRLARAAKNGHPSTAEHKPKKLWARKKENMDTMFEKALKALSKRVSVQVSEVREKESRMTELPLELDLGGTVDRQRGTMVNPVSKVVDLAPIVNCDRSYWRKSAGRERDISRPEKRLDDVKENSVIQVEH